MRPFEGALPDDCNPPAMLGEPAFRAAVHFQITPDLLPPELRSCLRPFEQMAPMAVPEAAVDEDHGPVLRQADVRLARKVAVQPVAEAPRVKSLADHQFRPGVLAADAGHHPAAGGGVDDVSQPRPSTVFRARPGGAASCVRRRLSRPAPQQNFRTDDRLGCPKRG